MGKEIGKTAEAVFNAAAEAAGSDVSPKMQSLIEGAAELGLRLVSCVVIIAAAFVIQKLIMLGIKGIFSRKNAAGRIIDRRKADTLETMGDSVVKYVVYSLAGFSVLTTLGVNPSSLIAVLGAGSVAIGLGAQNLIKDVIGGFFILLEDQFGVGDIVQISGFEGNVEVLSLRTTKVRGFDGSLYIIPNGSITTVVNMCKDYINAFVEVDIDREADMDAAIACVQDEMESAARFVDGLIATPEVLGVSALAGNSATIKILAKCAVGENYRIERELRLIIKKRLDSEGIGLPIPRTAVRIIKEGE